MKKYILILLFIQYGYSQCDKIENVYDEMKDVRTISTPYQSRINTLSGTYKNDGFVAAYRTIKKESNNSFIIFSGYTKYSSYTMKGLYIKLSNGEILRFEEANVKCSYRSNSTYELASYLVFSDEINKKLSEFTITEFTLGNENYKVKSKDAENFKTYFTCILNM